MSTAKLKNEITTMINSMSESQLMYVLQFVRFINQQSELLEEKTIREKKDLELINNNFVTMEKLESFAIVSDYADF